MGKRAMTTAVPRWFSGAMFLIGIISVVATVIPQDVIWGENPPVCDPAGDSDDFDRYRVDKNYNCGQYLEGIGVSCCLLVSGGLAWAGVGNLVSCFFAFAAFAVELSWMIIRARSDGGFPMGYGWHHDTQPLNFFSDLAYLFLLL